MKDSESCRCGCLRSNVGGLRVSELWLGKFIDKLRPFRAVLHDNYEIDLCRHKYGNTVTTDLWNAWKEAGRGV